MRISDWSSDVCSSDLFVDKAADLKAKGVDEIVCTAVNDAFVMGAWSKNANAGAAVTMLADGNGAFADAVGLTMDGTAFGMGQRGPRFSMNVNAAVAHPLHVHTTGHFHVAQGSTQTDQR